MSTRPRISFNESGECNACQWSEEKKIFDWEAQEKKLKDIIKRYASKNSDFDCIVPVSGGKDGGSIAHRLKNIYNLNPLCVTVRPATETEVGIRNVRNFVNSGFNHIHITPDQDSMRELNKIGLVDEGQPYYGWMVAIHTAIFRLALNYNISLIFYGEDGEVEYGGSTQNKGGTVFGMDYLRETLTEGIHESVMAKSSLSEKEKNFFTFPDPSEYDDKDLHMTHWSYFEPWDPYRNYLIAKEHCGLEEIEDSNSGTFTNFAQNDQSLYPLHCYLMYLKFGFGRALQDAGIEIRRGSMTREQAINLVKMYDGQYPEQYIDLYLDYYQMAKKEFDDVIDFHTNKKLFKKVDDTWKPKFEIK
jgi:N-acetyl sugar amidotransferase